MTNLKIIIAPDPRLLEVSKPVMEIDQDVKILLKDMLETMYNSNGIGLAAPQIGILKRLVVMDCSDQNTKKNPMKFVNPEILNFSSELSEFEEGCLSLPTQYAKVERPNKGTVIPIIKRPIPLRVSDTATAFKPPKIA